MIDIEAVKRAALTQFRLSQHSIHSLSHWERVRANGLKICAAEPDADLVVVECFAYLHDCQRHDDGSDHRHGLRAAIYCAMVRDTLLKNLSPKQFKLLAFAIEHHTDGKTTDAVTVGACWDADRLDLTRCGMQPQARLMSTATGKALARSAR